MSRLLSSPMRFCLFSFVPSPTSLTGTTPVFTQRWMDWSTGAKALVVWAKPLSEHYYCDICTLVFSEPVAWACGHSFCRHCALQWSQSSLECPVCRNLHPRNNAMKQPFTPARFIEECIGELQVYCPYGVVSKSFSSSSSTPSLKSEVEYGVMGEDFEAVYGGCPTVVSYSALARHSKSCQFAPGMCTKGCGYVGPFRYHNCSGGVGAQLTSNRQEIARLEDENKRLSNLIARAESQAKSKVIIPVHRPDYNYQRELVVELAQFFAFHFESLDSVEDLDTNRLFICIQTMGNNFKNAGKNGYLEYPEYFGNFRMLLSIVLAVPGWSNAQIAKYNEFLELLEKNMYS